MQDLYQAHAWTLMLMTVLRRVVDTGDAAARSARLEGQGSDARVSIDPELWANYRRQTIVAGLGSMGIPGNGSARSN